jgi:hypothetical protein
LKKKTKQKKEKKRKKKRKKSNLLPVNLRVCSKCYSDILREDKANQNTPQALGKKILNEAFRSSCMLI